MASFFTRLCLSNGFAREQIEQNKTPWDDLKAELTKGAAPQMVDDRILYAPAEMLCDRFTFALWRVEAENAAAAEETLRAAWSRLFPGREGEIRLFTAADDGSDRATLMREIYGGLYGAEEYLALTTELAASIPLLKERGAGRALRMQNYLFAIDPGCGFSTMLSSLANFMLRMGVFDQQEGERTKYIEYVLAAEDDGERVGPNSLLDQLLAEENKTAYGAVGLDVGCYLEGRKFDELRRLLNRLYRLQDQYVFVFRIPFLEKKAMDEVADVLSDLLPLRTVPVPPLDDCVLLEHLWDMTRSLGFRTNDAVTETFYARIRREKQDGRFYGFKTAEKIVHEMALEKTAHDAEEERQGRETDREFITPEDLREHAESKKKTGYDALADLVGMEEIAERVREIVSQVKLSMSDERLDRPCIHMRFTGSPGTGKTTVARILGQIFREEGILRKGAFIECSARSLCAEYVGQTAVRTATICRDAYGSVLFIDEAYALYEGNDWSNDYGREALTTLISEMENHRDDMLVIMAGYTDDMETLMKGNAGLRSRMPYLIHFPNYTRAQLFEIFMGMVRKHFDHEPELETEAKAYFEALSGEYLQSHEFANARFVRNLYERTWSKGALRASLAGVGRIRLTREDFLAASGEKEFGERLDKKARVGF